MGTALAKVSARDKYISYERYNEYVSKLDTFKAVKEAEYYSQQMGILPIIDKWLALYGGDQLIFDMIRNGMSLTEISKKLNINPSTLLRWKNVDPARVKGFKEAMVDASHLYIEQAELLLEELRFKEKVSRHEQKAILELVKFKKWKASVLNRANYGKAPKRDSSTTINNNIDLGDLHLTAVRAAGAEIMQEIVADGAA